MNRELRVLMLEDMPTDAELAEHELRRAGIAFTSIRVETRDAFIKALEEFHPDIVLSDYKLPDFNGMAALEIVQRDHPEIPVVMVTGALPDIEAVELIHAGARDYVLKDRLARLAPAVQRALSAEQGAHARKSAENALKQSEADMRTLVEHSPIAMLVDVGVDTDEKIVMMNQKFTGLFGYTLEDVPDECHWWPLAYPDEKYREEIKAEWTGRVEKAIQSHGDIEPMETTVTCKDGSIRCVRISLASIGSRNIIAFEDITERRQMEKNLLRSEAKFRTVYESSSDAIMLLDEKGFFDCNDAALRMFGYPKLDDFINEHPSQISPPTQPGGEDSASLANEHIATALKNGSHQFEWMHRRLDGSEFPAEVLLTAMELDGRQVLQGTVRDITERKHAEEKLRHYKDHLEEEVQLRTTDLVLARDAAEAANKAKSVFLSSISHELRTPLNAILGFSSLLRQDQHLSQAQRDDLDIINRSGEYLLTLINDVLEMSRIEAGRVVLESAPLDFGGMVRDVADMMHMRAQQKGLQLLIEQSSEFPRYIRGDEARLRQILINLVGNAVKFTRQGAVAMRFGIKPHDAQHHLLIEIEDTGIGISGEDQQQLFKPFVQLGKQAGDNKGTGLGLTITRQFVQLMGGTISVESAPGVGSIFRVELPIDKIEAGDVSGLEKVDKDEIIGLAPDQPVLRILIVEDQLENQLLLSRLMNRLGFAVKVAGNGQLGVQLFQSWQPQLIWMDRQMPVMDGLEATKAIRDLPGGREVKIVAVTASAFTEQRDEMLAAGMDDFVRKPYRASELYECLSRQLGVQYIYAGEQESEEMESPAALTTEMLAVLPTELHRELHDALESLEDERIAAAIGQVASLDPTLHRTISHLAKNFDYPAILKALQS